MYLECGLSSSLSVGLKDKLTFPLDTIHYNPACVAAHHKFALLGVVLNSFDGFVEWEGMNTDHRAEAFLNSDQALRIRKSKQVPYQLFLLCVDHELPSPCTEADGMSVYSAIKPLKAGDLSPSSQGIRQGLRKFLFVNVPNVNNLLVACQKIVSISSTFLSKLWDPPPLASSFPPSAMATELIGPCGPLNFAYMQ